MDTEEKTAVLHVKVWPSTLRRLNVLKARLGITSAEAIEVVLQEMDAPDDWEWTMPDGSVVKP